MQGCRELLLSASRALREAFRVQAELWEDYLCPQPPIMETPLHWVRDEEGWRLHGAVLPPGHAQPRRFPAPEREERRGAR